MSETLMLENIYYNMYVIVRRGSSGAVPKELQGMWTRAEGEYAIEAYKERMINKKQEK